MNMQNLKKYAIVLAMPLIAGCASMPSKTAEIKPVEREHYVDRMTEVKGYNISEMDEADIKVITEMKYDGNVFLSKDNFQFLVKDAHPHFQWEDEGKLEAVLKEADTNGDKKITHQELKVIKFETIADYFHKHGKDMKVVDY